MCLAVLYFFLGQGRLDVPDPDDSWDHTQPYLCAIVGGIPLHRAHLWTQAPLLKVDWQLWQRQ